MPNLEELRLNFFSSSTPIIDGDNLETNIVNHMTKLNRFIFNISSLIYSNRPNNLPSNEDIEKTFRNFKNNQIISNINYFSPESSFYCMFIRYHTYGQIIII